MTAITRARAGAGRRFFSFASGEQGAWYDPSDRSTLFQDSAGTIPVTAIGDPVGAVVNKQEAYAALFANGEQGAWYDPSDLSTLFQDSAGTIPVTAIGDPVGAVVNKQEA